MVATPGAFRITRWGVLWGDPWFGAPVRVDHSVSHRTATLRTWNPLDTALPPAHQDLAGLACPSSAWSTLVAPRAARLLEAIAYRRTLPAVVPSGCANLAQMTRMDRRPCSTPRRCSSRPLSRPRWRGRHELPWSLLLRAPSCPTPPKWCPHRWTTFRLDLRHRRIMGADEMCLNVIAGLRKPSGLARHQAESRERPRLEVPNTRLTQ